MVMSDASAVALKPATRAFRRIADRILWPSVVPAVLLLTWEMATRALHIRSIILPPPSEIAGAMITRHDLILSNLWPSLYLTLVGFSLSVIGGILMAMLITSSPLLRTTCYPTIVISQIVPKISIAPLFIFWFGTGTLSSLLLAFLVAFFPMTINAAMGFQSVDEDIHRMARTFMGSRWQIFWKIQMPHALPFIFSGMKISITLAIIGVIVSEFVASQEGIGYLIKLAGGLLDTPLMMAAITALSIAGFILYFLIAIAERWAVYWQASSDFAAGGHA